MAQQSQSNVLMIIVLVIVVGIAAYVLNAPDKRNPVQKLGDAIEQLPKGTDKAARELKDRTPGEKLGDAVKDEGDDVKKSTNQQ